MSAKVFFVIITTLLAAVLISLLVIFWQPLGTYFTRNNLTKNSPMPPTSTAAPSEKKIHDIAGRREALQQSVLERLPQLQGSTLWSKPRAMCLISIKSQRRLELWLADQSGKWHFIKDYPVLGQAGVLGPKLREGDRQVPEGIYGVAYLNPNSSYHLGLMLDYPNAFDRKKAQADGRSTLGGEIAIHGSDRSAGCLAMGDEAIEEIFVLASKLQREAITVIIAPYDLRVEQVTFPQDPPVSWLEELYAMLQKRMQPFTRH